MDKTQTEIVDDILAYLDKYKLEHPDESPCIYVHDSREEIEKYLFEKSAGLRERLANEEFLKTHSVAPAKPVS